MAHLSFLTRNACGHLRIGVLVGAAMLAADVLRADTIVVKHGAGTSTVEGAIEEINASEVVYRPAAASDRDTIEPFASVLQIKAATEPELSAAEQAYADGKWADAVTLYHRTLSLSGSDWAKCRATVRLIDASGMAKDFGLQAKAFVKLAFPDNKAVKDLIIKLNVDHKIKINTIVFSDNLDPDADIVELMKRIAKENDGRSRLVAERELIN